MNHLTIWMHLKISFKGVKEEGVEFLHILLLIVQAKQIDEFLWIRGVLKYFFLIKIKYV